MKASPEEIEALLKAHPGATVLGTRDPGSPATARGRFAFTIPDHRPASLNEITKRGNHFSAARLKRLDRQLITLYADQAGVPKATGRRRVSIQITLAGRMKECDPDAFYKSTLDGLRAAGLLVDDSPAWVELGPVTQVRGEAKATTILLEDIS